MHKAKSRLSRGSEPTREVEKAKDSHSHPPSPATTSHRGVPRSNLLTSYFRQLPTLIMSLPFGAVLLYILITISPERIAHLPVPNSYLGLLIPFFLFAFWVLTFVLLNARRGFFVSLLLTLFLFFKLQNVLFTWQVVLYPLLFFTLLEILYRTFIFSKR